MEDPEIPNICIEDVNLSLSLQEPSPKKQKMSITTSDDEDLETTTATTDGPTLEKKPRYKRRKIAIFFAYCGVGYQGMQKNPGAKTIEGDLEEALFHSGAVPEHDRGRPKRFDWARSARTDKGVSAVGQVVSGRFYVDPPGFVDRLNSNLPPQIRIFGYKRATASFNAKKFCDRRRYVYLIPVFALDPCAHRDRESVMASLGSGNELVKCLECSERGRKVIGVMGKRSFETKTDTEVISAESGILSNNETAISHKEVEEETMFSKNNGESKDIDSEPVKELENGTAENESIVLNSDPAIVEQEIEDECAKGKAKPEEKSGFCYGEKEKERFNRILKYYEGTHNFHNFTTRTKAEDPSARRYIVSFQANTTVTVEGIDFVKCEVVGQSFMLHQIRKMIGVAIAIMRNCASESLIETALQQNVNINVPTAPEVGLYLDECFFASYNQKWNGTHEELSMKAYSEEAEDFKMKYIYTHIASTEHNEGIVALWLHSLNHRNYPDLCAVSNSGTMDGNSAEVENLDE
ncbi:unnamed protein product [Ilex paraguariensis]|uniref:Pseudouridine synthase I TruA alpha/beta domain-containing protein n=1 Tax=Ilex paraguariensis TaxID=185542 RepID=A0ABC8UDB0_9AQUA